MSDRPTITANSAERALLERHAELVEKARGLIDEAGPMIHECVKIEKMLRGHGLKSKRDEAFREAGIAISTPPEDQQRY